METLLRIVLVTGDILMYEKLSQSRYEIKGIAFFLQKIIHLCSYLNKPFIWIYCEGYS